MDEEDKIGFSDVITFEVIEKFREMEKPFMDLSVKEQEKLATDISEIVYDVIDNYFESLE